MHVHLKFVALLTALMYIAYNYILVCRNESRLFQAQPVKEHNNVNLTIIHVNDIHSHFEEFNSYTGRRHMDQAQNLIRAIGPPDSQIPDSNSSGQLEAGS